VLRRNRDGTQLVEWKDSWQIEADVYFEDDSGRQNSAPVSSESSSEQMPSMPLSLSDWQSGPQRPPQDTHEPKSKPKPPKPKPKQQTSLVQQQKQQLEQQLPVASLPSSPPSRASSLSSGSSASNIDIELTSGNSVSISSSSSSSSTADSTKQLDGSNTRSSRKITPSRRLLQSVASGQQRPLSVSTAAAMKSSSSSSSSSSPSALLAASGIANPIVRFPLLGPSSKATVTQSAVESSRASSKPADNNNNGNKNSNDKKNDSSSSSNSNSSSSSASSNNNADSQSDKNTSATQLDYSKTRRSRKRRKKALPASGAPSEALIYEFDYETPPSSDEDDKQPEALAASKRRVATPENWKRNNRVKKAVSEKPPCGCGLRCFHRIGRKTRKNTRSTFQGLDRAQQKGYMRALIDLHPVKFVGKALQIRKRNQRLYTAQYHLQVASKRHHVCLKAFLGILGVGSKQVKNLNAYVWANPGGALVPEDGRGKHANRPNRIPSSVVAQIDTHIKAFPREDSHYSLHTNNKYLSPDLSVGIMHRLYLAKYEPHVLPNQEQDEGKADAEPEGGDADDQKEQQKPQVSYDFYNERFRRFDLKFGLPTVDSCALCDELTLNIEAATDEDNAEALRAQRRAHLVEADRGYAMRKHDQKLAEASRAADPNWECPVTEFCSWDGTEYLCSDMAGVLQTPRVSTNKAFYYRKLNTYCYGLYSGQAGQHTLGFWDETMAKKGANEVISCAHRFFVLRNTGATQVSWWGDNTSSQMHNQYMMLYNNELVHEDGFTYFHRIDNKYSPPGHTFMENDRAFGVISRKAKRTKVIGSSKAWMKLAKKSKQPNYHTMWMDRKEFRDWKGFLSAKYERPSRCWRNTEGEIVPFMKVRWFNYGVAEGPDGALVKHPDEVWYRLSLDTKEPWKKIVLDRRVRMRDTGLISDDQWTLYPEPLALAPKKVADLSKFKAWLPLEFHSLYPDPPRKRKRSDGEEDGDDDAVDTEDDDDRTESDEDNHEAS
jgi:hypothetical protein